MSHRSKIIKEWVDVQVTDANQTFKEKFEVDKHAAAIIGITITSTNNNLAYNRGSQRIVINDMELYPEGYESKELMQNTSVSANQRIINIDGEITPGNRIVEIGYKDQDHPDFAFQPYKVRLYIYSRIDKE